MLLKNETYDQLKNLALIIIPALATCIISISDIWGFSNGGKIAGTVTAIGVFLGVVLKISTKKYNDKQNADSEGEGDHVDYN